MTIDYKTLYVHVDDFCKGFLPWWNHQLLEEGIKKRKRDSKMKMSQIITILIAYHQSGYNCFGNFYVHLLLNGRKEFPCMLSYSRFISLVKRTLPLLLTLFDSLKGEIVKLVITPGNVDDRAPVTAMIKGMRGKLFGDRGYLSKEKFNTWYNQGVQVITGIKKNMKNKLMDLGDKVLLRRRGFLETIFSSIKSLGVFEHSRHRCVTNALCHIRTELISYQMRDDKPSLLNQSQIS